MIDETSEEEGMNTRSGWEARAPVRMSSDAANSAALIPALNMSVLHCDQHISVSRSNGTGRGACREENCVLRKQRAVKGQ